MNITIRIPPSVTVADLAKAAEHIGCTLRALSDGSVAFIPRGDAIEFRRQANLVRTRPVTDTRDL